MSELLIQLTDVGKSYQQGATELEVLQQINLQIYRGESVAIVGQSGSGKSTLLSIIGLLENLGVGRYLLCGQDVTTLSGYQLSLLRNRHLGWVFQNFNLVPELTIAANVALPLRYNPNYQKKDYRALVDAKLAVVGLIDKAESYPGQLSGGQQQRVAIARALVTNPDILLCDEPTGNLDSTNSENIIKLLLELNQQGTTVLLVTHDPALAARCSRTIQISDGRISDVVPGTRLSAVRMSDVS
ncbi:MAG: ABC transporter ATP-binding protein [Gammaproteobacteria bacterium]|nr:ABC transporter ATP-binding protein [Gammaproteobacteria bacterium]